MPYLNKFIVTFIIFCAHGQVLALPESSSGVVGAVQKKTISQAVERVSKQVEKKIPVTAISTSPIPGLYQVTSDLNVFYVTGDGEVAIFGDLVNTGESKNNWNFTENAMRKLRVQALNALHESDMIVFPATKPLIATITVFTDIDCPYCHKMQEHMKEYNDLGIEVRYLSFPRSGPKTKSFDEAIRVWCAKDRPKAYTDAIDDKIYPKETCNKNPVMMEYELGQKMGITGTPTIILDNGAKLSGMLSPKDLEKFIVAERQRH